MGVHEDGKWKGKDTFIPFNERVEIIQSNKYVDKVIRSKTEDMDVWPEEKYDILFVGSDYKGSERFKRYENYFGGTKAKIVYFPYTETTSSSKLRQLINLQIESGPVRV